MPDLEKKLLLDRKIALNNHFKAVFLLLKDLIHNKELAEDCPWYLFLGPKNCGISTLLHTLTPVNTGELDKLNAHPAYQWTITKQGVFISCNTEINEIEWQTLLKCLNRYGKNLNGIVFVLNIDYILDERINRNSAEYFSMQTKMLAQTFPSPIPIYTLISKCDKICGFQEYFRELDENNLQQSLGFPLSEQLNSFEIETKIKTGIKRLIKQLAKTVIPKLHTARHPEKRQLIRDFPLQLESLEPLISVALNKLAQPFLGTRFNRIRGIYFISVKQHNAPIDRLLQPINQSLALVENGYFTSTTRENRNYFTHDFFSYVLPQTQTSFSQNSFSRITATVQKLAVFSAVLLTILGGWKLLDTYKKDHNHIHQLEANMEDYRLFTKIPKATTAFEKLRALQELNQQLQELKPSILYSKAEKAKILRLRSKLQEIYTQQIKTQLFPILRSDKFKSATDIAQEKSTLQLFSDLVPYLVFLTGKEGATDGKTPDIHLLQTHLIQLNKYLEPFTNGQDSAKYAFETLKQRMEIQNPDPIDYLIQDSQNLPEPIGKWLAAAADNCRLLILQIAQNHIENVWSNTVAQEYQRTIQNHFPINKQAGAATDVKDFIHFFSPHGTLNQFVSYYLTPFVDMNQSPWQFKKINNLQLTLPALTIKNLQHGSLITRAFFPTGEDDIKLFFSLKAIALEPSLERFVLNIGTQQIDVFPDDYENHPFIWSTSKTDETIDLTFIKNAHQSSTKKISEPWSLLRLMDMGLLQPTEQSKKYQLTLDLNGNAVKLLLITAAEINPFIPGLLQGYQNPEKLFS